MNIISENELVKYISKYMDLPDELKTVVIESTVIRHYKKGEILLKENQHANEGFLVLKGCVRDYIIKDGEEKTIEFYTEEQPITIASYGKNVPSGHFLECVEDTTVSVGTPEHEAEMLKKYPQFDAVCRIISEVMMANLQTHFADYKLMSSEERYLDFIKTRPALIQKVPQYQIASYLGMTPESLSRLRKRLLKKQA
ncbi:MAG: Crp/Fnr family transcriptional regulator [Spirosomaceae bacterium]|nr:Crp/Fnr family transcriptional regulator [Spirosomataceae bacterium]